MDRKKNFTIKIEPMRDYIEVSLQGFLDMQSVSVFDTEFRAAKARLSNNRSKHVTLVDISELKIQPQNVVSDFALMLSDPVIRSARLAFVVGDSLIRMQLRRLLNENAAVFETVSEARDWLFS